jgi:putative aldouronate transport system substrate-binding protein
MKLTITIAVVLVLSVQALVFGSGRTQSGGAQVEVSAPGVFPITKEKTTLDTLLVMYPWDNADLINNGVFKEMEELTNVHLNLSIVPAEELKTRLTILFSSGTYPELILAPDFATTDELSVYGIQEKILLPLDDLISQHAPNLKAYAAQAPWIYENVIASDGKIYGIPGSTAERAIGHGAVTNKLWFNKEWVDKLGLKMPTTTEEFRDVLRAFKTRDPNGNGKADEVPMSGFGTAQPWHFLINSFGYYDDLQKYKAGVYSPTVNQDYIRDALQYIKSLYDEGLIDPASLTQSEGQLGALGNNPDALILGAAACFHLGQAVDTANVDRSKMYTALEPLRGPNGYRAIPFGSDMSAGSITAGITDKAKNPAVAIKYLDAFCTEAWAVRATQGSKGVAWDTADPGTFGMDGKTPAKYKYLEIPGHEGKYRFNNNLSIAFVWNNWKNFFQVTGNIWDPANYEARLVQETVKLGAFAADADPLPKLNYDTNIAARQAQLYAPLKDFVEASFAEFITGRANFTTGWETYKQSLEQLGYSEYIRNQQEAYNRTKK